MGYFPPQQIGFGLSVLLLLSCALLASGATADYPAAESGDFLIHDFNFQSGVKLPELKIHYRTLGTPRRDEKGLVRNAVLFLHGTTGNGSNFLRPEFAGELFGKGQLLDASEYISFSRTA